MIDTTDFLYEYPNINKNNECFSHDIYKKYEFQNLEDTEQDKTGLFDHQKIVSRFMNPYTDYTSLLIYHGLGTGKCVLPDSKVYTIEFGNINIEKLWNIYFDPDNCIVNKNEPEIWLIMPWKSVRTMSLVENNKCEPTYISKLYKQYVREEINTVEFFDITKTSSLLDCSNVHDIKRISMTKRHKVAVLNTNTNVVYYTNNYKQGDYIIGIDNGIKKIYVIHHIITFNYVGMVYDVEVDNDCHNYLVQGILTHNTCSAIAVSEQLHNMKAIEKTIVITRGTVLAQNFIDQLVYVCSLPKYRYIHTQHEKLTQRQQQLASKRLYGKRYQFTTFIKFARALAQKQKKHRRYDVFVDVINKEYKNCLFIIDEAHNIKPNSDDNNKAKINVYNTLHSFFHELVNKRILLMSGTPVRDSVFEIAYLMNIILPLDKQLPTENNFIKEYIDPETNVIHDNGLLTLKNAFIGRVSYYNPVFKNIAKKYMGISGIGGLEHFTVFSSFMTAHQSASYMAAIQKDLKTKGSGIFALSRQASLFVDKQGNYGHKINLSDILQHLKTINSIEKKLDYINLFSCKYSYVIRHILDNKNDNIFIYNMFVKGSGLNVLAKLLTAFGCIQSNGNERTKRPNRFAIITNEISNPKRVMNIINTFNSDKNMNGDYLRIIIGSRIISEGLSFKNIKHVHILTPFWNFTDTDQAIARAIRLNSHQALIKAGHPLPITIKIYIHVAIPNRTQEHQEYDDDGNDDDEDTNNDNDDIQQDYNDVDFDEDEELKRLEEEMEMILDTDDDDEENIIPNDDYEKVEDLDENINENEEYPDEDNFDQNDNKEENIQTSLSTITIKNSRYSIDLYMCKISEYKDLQNKRVERLLKEISFDCFLHKTHHGESRNHLVENSRECDYTTCDIKCFNQDICTNNTIDYTTYNLLYETQYRDKIIHYIKLYFQSNYKTTLQKLLNFCKEYDENIEEKQLQNVLSYITMNNMFITNNIGIYGFLKYNNNTITFVYNKDPLINYYYKQGWFQKKNDIASFVKNYEDEQDVHILKKLVEHIDTFGVNIDDDRYRCSIFSSISSNNIDEIFKNVVMSPENSPLKRWILNTFTYLFFNTYHYQYIVRTPLSVLQYDGMTWKRITTITNQEDMDELNTIIRDTFLKNDPLPYYGIYNISNSMFYIRSIDNIKNMRKRKGTDCNFLKIVELCSNIILPARIEIISDDITKKKKKTDEKLLSNHFTEEYLKDLSVDDKRILSNALSSSKTELCTSIFTWFQENNKLQIVA